MLHLHRRRGYHSPTVCPFRFVTPTGQQIREHTVAWEAFAADLSECLRFGYDVAT